MSSLPTRAERDLQAGDGVERMLGKISVHLGDSRSNTGPTEAECVHVKEHAHIYDTSRGHLRGVDDGDSECGSLTTHPSRKWPFYDDSSFGSSPQASLPNLGLLVYQPKRKNTNWFQDGLRICLLCFNEKWLNQADPITRICSQRKLDSRQQFKLAICNTWDRRRQTTTTHFCKFCELDNFPSCQYAHATAAFIAVEAAFCVSQCRLNNSQ